MMIPIVLTGDFMIDTANKILEVGQQDRRRRAGEGTARGQRPAPRTSIPWASPIKVLRVTPIDEKTIQMMINALGRFTLKQRGPGRPGDPVAGGRTIPRRIIPAPR